jgi:hypothetical protein
MSGARIAHELADTLAALARAVLGWGVLAPVALLMPRRRDWIAVIGRDDGRFVDNCKYFLLQGAASLDRGMRMAFVTERRETAAALREAGYEALVFPDPACVGYLLRTGTTVVDSNEWWFRWRRFLLLGSKLVQLWHGVGFKRIENDKWRNEAKGWLTSGLLLRLRLLKRLLTGRFVRYDLVATTSAFYRDRVFAPAFHARLFPVTGYPRNTFGRLPGRAGELAWWNVDPSLAERARRWVEDGRRIVLVAPTFRDSRATPMSLDPATVAMIDRFCEEQRVEMVFKFHSHERGASSIRGLHLHQCAPESDLYPLFPLASALVTDYSSIYMDFLLLDRPVLFFVPDLDEYLATDRQLQFDFEEMTPGPKATDWEALVANLKEQWNRDDYVTERARLRQLAFDEIPQEEAVPKLFALMRQQGWLIPSHASRPDRK